MTQSKQIKIHNPSETGTLKTVVMRLIAPFRLLTSAHGLLEPSIIRQIMHNRFVPYNVEKAQAQQLELKNTLEEHGARVLLLPPIANSGGHYMRDVGFAIDDNYFVARMGTHIREQEVVALGPLVSIFSNVVKLEKGHVEGGDVILAPGRVLIGLGEASNMEGVESVKQALAKIGSEREVIPLKFNSSGVIHLDTQFNLVAPDLAIISKSAFEKESLGWLENNFELIEATDEETRAIHINTFGIGNGNVIMDQRALGLADILRSRGLNPILIDYSEITCLPGSFRCSTLPLERLDN